MGTLYLIATPIGNIEDLSHRAIRILGEVGALACEDTRITRRLFERYTIESPRTFFSYHEHNEVAAGNRILGLLEQGVNVGLCTDGGYPGISDPGYRIVASCCEAGHPIEVIPGASAVPVALLLSGLSTSSYTFKGFPPRKSGPRKRFLEMDRELPHTLVIYESPFRVVALLKDAFDVFGDRHAAVCIELTKKFEKVHRGFLSELASTFGDQTIKGEVVVVIAGNHPKFQRDADTDDEEGASDFPDWDN